MKHIKPFPFPNVPEHLQARADLLAKIVTGVLVQPSMALSSLAAGDTVHEWQRWPCWLHAAKWCDTRGYKKIRYKGHILYVHRTVCELVNGPVPQDRLVDHLCKVRGCCQPKHLEAVPPKVNIERGDNPNWLMRNSVEGASLLVTDVHGGEPRVVANYPGCRAVKGYIGEQPVEIVTDRPTYWTTPELMQAHIDYGHPRFRTPSWRSDAAVLPVKERVYCGLRIVEVASIPEDHCIVVAPAPPSTDIVRHIVERNPPDTVQVLEDGSVYIPYTVEDQAALASSVNVTNNSRLARRMHRWLRVFMRGITFRIGVPSPRS